ncbi:quinone oxidoreductase family protein [Falsarthrobacter nasiphocae]
MTAVRAHRTGGPDVLTPETVPVPSPGEGEALIRVAATGVNFIETYQRSGAYPVEFPAVLGTEASGVVVALGPGDHAVSVGDRVTTASARGAYAEYCLAPSSHLIPVPDGLELELACAASLQGLTAHYLITSVARVEPGQWVLVHAGAGGVGQVAIQLLARLGARVISTASTPEKRELASAAGAEHSIGYEGFADTVRTLTDGRGVSAVLDGVGRATFDDSLRSLDRRGTLALFGAASGPVPPVDPQALNKAGSVTLCRPSLPDFLADPEERRWRAEEVFGPLATGELRVEYSAYPLAEAAAAHTALEGRATTGKTVLTP